jgi:hypothetical protein
MRNISTRIIINKPVEYVWNVFNDIDSFKEWNPYISSIAGDLYVGNKIEITTHLPNSTPKKLKPIVRKYRMYEEIVWVHKKKIFNLLQRKHTFKFMIIDDDTTMFLNEERFSGSMLPLIWQTLNNNLRSQFELMNVAFKQRCESK